MTLSELNDETLVSLSLVGNDKAYEELVRRYQRAVIGAAHAILRDYHLAEDAAQDAFVSAWVKLDRLRDASLYGTWVCRISKNRACSIAERHRDFVDFDILENVMSDVEGIPDELIIGAEESAELRRLVDSLPEKIRTVVYLHYYEGLSVAEIAFRLNIPDGTVKWRLSDGRRRLGKEYGIMTEKEKAFVERVMKKVEELKLWRLKSDKSGFEEEYRALLADIDKMPESEEKYHAMADTLKLGYWWVEGEKNDEVVARIREAAGKCHNEDIAEFLFHTDNEKLSGKAKIEYIRDKQIPALTADGYKNALGCAWFWLGCEYHRARKLSLAKEAFGEVIRVSKKDYIYRANAVSALRALEFNPSDEKYMYKTNSYSEEYRYIDGNLRTWSQPGYTDGYMMYKYRANYINWFAAGCEHTFFDETMSVGESMTASDGAMLTFVSDSETVETPCGVFESCQLWRTHTNEMSVDTYYKRGVGIVRQVGSDDGGYEQLLCAYDVHGDGLMPMAEGNRWEYRLSELPKNIEYECIYETVYADDKKVTMAMYYGYKRTYWDENDWYDMILAMRQGYVREDEDSSEHLVDVSRCMERAETLAATPYECAHTKAACTVMRRIFDTDAEWNPSRTASGHWNFFSYLNVLREDGRITVDGDRTYEFEWKDMAKTHPEGTPMLFNDIYEIIRDDTQCIWSDEWTVGTDTVIEFTRWSNKITTHLTVTDAGDITTAAGTFKNCVRVSLDTKGWENGLRYRGGKRNYYFAPTVGIVRTTRNYYEDRICVYELTSYEGVGEGMFPTQNGMMRRYDALGLRDGYVGSAVYTYTEKDGGTVIFADRTGIRRL